MILRNTMLAAALLLATTATVEAGKPATTLEMQATGEVQIAPDGHVSDYRVKSELPPAVADLVDRNVRSWRFEPVLVDGTPVVAKTAMHMRLTAERVGDTDSYKMKIAAVDFGASKIIGTMVMPSYPTPAVRAGVGARVLLAMRIDAEGNVAEVLPYQTSLDRRVLSDHDAEQWRKLFEKASIAAAKNWHYDPSETINGKAMGNHVLAPLSFTLSNGRDPAPGPGQEKWRALVPGPVHPVPWMAGAPAVDGHDFSKVADNDTLSLDSRFKLKNDVIGKTL